MSRSMNVFLSALNTTLSEQNPIDKDKKRGMNLNSKTPSDWKIRSNEDINVSNDAVNITVQISNPEHGEKEETEEMRVCLSQTVEQLTEELRRRLNVSRERIIRFSSAENPSFDIYQSLRENGVTAGSVLSAVINSEKTQTAADDPTLTNRGRDDSGETPINGKLPFTKPEDIQLLLNIQRLVDRLFRHSNRLWPRDSVGHVIANATLSNSADFLRSSDEPKFVLSISSPNSIPRCLNPSSTLIIDGTPIQLTLSPELKESLHSWMTSDGSDTTDSSVTVDEEEKISISVALKTGETILWSTYEEQISFGELLEQMALEMEPKVPPQTSLYCLGCGRRLAFEEKEAVMIPVECCQKRSLDLSDRRPRFDEEDDETVDEREVLTQESQTEIIAYDAQIQSDLPRQRDRGVEAVPQLSNKGVPTMRIIVLAQETQASCSSCDNESQTEEQLQTQKTEEESLADRTVDFPVRLKLKGGRKDLWFCARSDDTLGSLITLLRRSQLLMGVSDVRRGRRSLRTTDSEWRSKLLTVDCGLHPGDELHLDAVSAPSVFTALESPTHNAASVHTVHISRGEADWSHVKRQIQHLLTSPVVACQWGAFHTRHIMSRGSLHSSISSVTRHSIFCIEPEKEKSTAYRDEEDGKELDGTCVVSHWSHEFVREGSGLRSSPKMLPVLSVLLFPKLVVLHGKRFRETDVDALFDTEFLALVFGLEHSRSKRWFAELSPGLSFCDSKTGEVYPDAEAVVKLEDDEMEEGWKRLLILLKDGDRVPKCKLPDERYVYVRVRHPVTMDVVDDKLCKVAGEVPAGESVWTMTPDINLFQRKFTNSMRRGSSEIHLHS